MDMRLIRSAAVVVGLTAAVTLGLGTQAQASTNSGWVYTLGSSGAAYFDADLNGYAGVEKITVCDNESDGRGIRARVTGQDGDGTYYFYVSDPSNDGTCVSTQYNYFLE